jgi:hypothetical protein
LETEPFSIRIWPSNKAVYHWQHSKNKVPKTQHLAAGTNESSG